MVILDFHKYLGKPVPWVRRETTRDPSKIGNVETGMQHLLGVYVTHTKDTEPNWRQNELRIFLNKKFGALEESVLGGKKE